MSWLLRALREVFTRPWRPSTLPPSDRFDDSVVYIDGMEVPAAVFEADRRRELELIPPLKTAGMSRRDMDEWNTKNARISGARLVPPLDEMTSQEREDFERGEKRRKYHDENLKRVREEKEAQKEAVFLKKVRNWTNPNPRTTQDPRRSARIAKMHFWEIRKRALPGINERLRLQGLYSKTVEQGFFVAVDQITYQPVFVDKFFELPLLPGEFTMSNREWSHALRVHYTHRDKKWFWFTVHTHPPYTDDGRYFTVPPSANDLASNQEKKYSIRDLGDLVLDMAGIWMYNVPEEFTAFLTKINKCGFFLHPEFMSVWHYYAGACHHGSPRGVKTYPIRNIVSMEEIEKDKSGRMHPISVYDFVHHAVPMTLEFLVRTERAGLSRDHRPPCMFADIAYYTPSRREVLQSAGHWRRRQRRDRERQFIRDLLQ